MTLYDFPALNATLNGLSTVLLLAGWLFIRKRHVRAHLTCMISALVTSTVFLGCYLYYHAHAGSVKFTHAGAPKRVYLSILISHTILAVAVLPFIVMAVWNAIRRRFDVHKKWARIAWPMWMYVSVTGVIVYMMLYQWFPAEEVLRRRALKSPAAASQ